MKKISLIVKVHGHIEDEKGYVTHKVNDEMVIRDGQDPICEALRRNATLRACNVVSCSIVGKFEENIMAVEHVRRKDIPNGGLKFDFREVNPDV